MNKNRSDKYRGMAELIESYDFGVDIEKEQKMKKKTKGQIKNMIFYALLVCLVISIAVFAILQKNSTSELLKCTEEDYEYILNEINKFNEDGELFTIISKKEELQYDTDVDRWIDQSGNHNTSYSEKVKSKIISVEGYFGNNEKDVYTFTFSKVADDNALFKSGSIHFVYTNY